MPPYKHPLFKRLLLWTGSVVVLLVLGVLVLGIRLSAQNGDFDAPFYPFVSQEAQREYLAYYDKKAQRWPVPSVTRTIRGEYGSTFVRISGPVNGAPLVLLHGGGGNALQWIPHAAALSKQFRVYAIDNIYDNGRSIPSKMVGSADDYVRWLDELLNALHLDEPLNMVGLSYGGWITAHYALRHPQRLRKIVLLTPAATVLPFSAEWLIRALPVLLQLPFFTHDFIYWLAEDTLRSGPQGRALIDDYLDEKFLTLRSFRGRVSVMPDVLSDAQLRSLGVPTLYIVGEHEKIYSAHEAIKRLHSVAPQIETLLIGGAGHDLLYAKPDAVNAAIVAFLSTGTPKP